MLVTVSKFLTSNYFHSDPVNNAIRNYEYHPSLKKICETLTITSTFPFSGIDKADVEKLIGNLNSSKVKTLKNITTKCLKETSDICSPFLAAIWNQEFILNKKFPQELKLADITLAHKKEDSTKVKNYRPVSALPTVPKVFKRLLQKQISENIYQFLSPFLDG